MSMCVMLQCTDVTLHFYYRFQYMFMMIWYCLKDLAIDTNIIMNFSASDNPKVQVMSCVTFC